MNTAEFSIMPHLGIVFLLLQLYPEFGSREPIPHIIAFVYLHQFYPRYLEAFRKKLELENQKPSKQKEIIKQRRETRVQLSYDYHLLVALFLLWFLSVLNCRHWAVTLIFLLYLLWVLADLEILRWLNYGTEMLWPKMEEYASKKVFQPIVDWFLEKHKPSTLKKARVQWLSLGSNPPSITDFHSFRNSDSNWGLVIELGINFSADNHMKSTLATKPRDGSGSGKWVKLNMTELYVDGKVLIVVNFINHRPFVSCLQVCFVQPPYLKMTSKPVMTRELEVEKPPLIFRKLDDLCSVAVKEKLVWPSTLKLDMERYAATCTENTESCFFLDVKEPVAYVRVGDIKAFSLNPRWFPVDWYVEVRVGDRKWRSRAQRTQSPCWDEEYKIPVPTWLDKIMVKVCYEGILGGMIYGFASILYATDAKFCEKASLTLN